MFMCKKNFLGKLAFDILERKKVGSHFIKLFSRGQNESRSKFLDSSEEIVGFNELFSYKEGACYPFKKVLLKHRLNTSLQVEYFHSSKIFGSDYANKSLDLHKSLVNARRQDEVFSFLLLKSIRGGFKIYHRGIVGFLPRSHMHFILKNLKKKFSSYSSSNVQLQIKKNSGPFSSVVSLLTHRFKKYKILRFPVVLNNSLTLQPYRHNRLFSKSSRKQKRFYRKRSFRGRIDVVFLCKKYSTKLIKKISHRI